MCIEKYGRITYTTYIQMSKYFSLGTGITDDFKISLFIRFFLLEWMGILLGEQKVKQYILFQIS